MLLFRLGKSKENERNLCVAVRKKKEKNYTSDFELSVVSLISSSWRSFL